MILAVDTGGTKTLLAKFSDGGEMMESTKSPTPQSYYEYMDILKGQIAAIGVDDLRAISVAVPGVVEDDTVIWLGNLNWQNPKIAEELKSSFGVPVVMENDANLAGLSESEGLVGKILYVTISTGIGAGIVEDGQISKGLKNFEPGHDKYEYDGKVMEWEDFASGKAIFERFGKPGSEITDEKALREVSKRIAVGLVPVIKNIEPNTVVIGGSMGVYLDRYLEYLKQDVMGQLLGGTIPDITKARHPEEAVVYGCYLYAKNRLFSR